MSDEPLELEDVPSGIDRKAWNRHALLSPTEMGEADRLAIEGGLAGYDLMQAAGNAVFDAVTERFPIGRVAVLCGPGNNGGDGFVVAERLLRAGWDVRLGLLGDRSALKGDAAQAAADFTGGVEPLTPGILDGADIIVDALFGAGLNREVDGVARATLDAAGDRPIIAVDIPSGVSGSDGCTSGHSTKPSALTVTFFRGKPGHHLLPGRELCGERVLTDIGIPESVLDSILPETAENHPSLWREALPVATPYSHKYSRGCVLITGGAEMIGAACLAARASQRAGAGIVLVASPLQQAPLYKLALESAVVRTMKDTRGFIELLEDPRIGAAVVGPGLGLHSPGGHEKVLAVLRRRCAAILDADALTLFAEAPQSLFDEIQAPTILTPHDGEFTRLFPDLADRAGRLERARAAAVRSGAVVVLKGYDTVVADPSGYAVVNSNAPPELATAGSGDVLSGVIAALAAGGMPPFAAAAAAVYLHGDAASQSPVGLIASDLPDRLPDSIERCRSVSKN
ncbi:MAG: NAD(P)H-hydrate dehydratase [Alphaproteobacteria bacterium]|nr:NAD(P)H-hydrate dehydratase [Alphaproteobacteria bacterium]